MTTIIAREIDGDVEIACDSMVTGHGQYELGISKIFVNSGVVYGVAGALVCSTQLRHAKLPSPPEATTNADAWVTNTLAPAIRAVLSQSFKFMNDGYYHMQVLAIINNVVYDIDAIGGWVRRTDGLYNIGSGGLVARTAIEAGASLEKAMELAGKLDSYTGGPYTVTTASKMLKEAEGV